MPRAAPEPGAPLRVVVFTGGPVLDAGVKRFLARLEEHPEILVTGVFCEAKEPGPFGVVRDLWRRRGALALPLLVLRVAGALGPPLLHPLRAARLRRRVGAMSDRIHFVPDLHAPAARAALRRLAPDLGLIYGGPILKPGVFEIPSQGTLGIHHGKVPEYRGKKTTFWAIFNGEETAGVTIQRVSARLDRGDVVCAGEVPIGRAPLGAVWRRLERLGLDLYLDAVLSIKRGTATFAPQPAGPGRLYRDPKLRDILAFWRRSLRRFLWG